MLRVEEQLQDLKDARALIHSCQLDIVHGPIQPWQKLENARRILRKQMDELVAFMFYDEPGSATHQNGR